MLIPDIVAGIISDISLSGCAFEMIKGGGELCLPDIRINDSVKIRIQFPGHVEMIEFMGSVRRTQRDGKRLNLGIKFAESDSDTVAGRGKIAEYFQALEKFV